jgi:hypothetical protein
VLFGVPGGRSGVFLTLSANDWLAIECDPEREYRRKSNELFHGRFLTACEMRLTNFPHFRRNVLRVSVTAPDNKSVEKRQQNCCRNLGMIVSMAAMASSRSPKCTWHPSTLLRSTSTNLPHFVK